MICVIKHIKSNKFVQSAFGKINVNNGAIDKTSVQFQLTTNMQKARLIEDPSINDVQSWGCEAIPVKSTQSKLEQAYRIIEHE